MDYIMVRTMDIYPPSSYNLTHSSWFDRSENLDLSLSVPHGLHNGYAMADQTFHTPSFGDEDFDIPPINPQSSHSHPQANMGSYHQTPMSMPMSQTTDSMSMNNNASGYQQPLYLSPSHEHNHNMGINVSFHEIMEDNQLKNLDDSASYSSPPQPQSNYSQIHLMQHQQNQPPQQVQQQQVQQQAQQQQAQQQAQQHQHHYNMGPPYGRSPQGNSPPGTHPGTGHENTTTSDDSDDSTPHAAVMVGMKRPSPEPADNNVGKIQKKPKPQKKKKKRDPNEPQKPVSAYALFFRDTQAAIKGQNPNASFGEVSKIVASMWDALDAEHKNVYKKKTEAAKKDYLKALAAYRASLVSKGASETDNMYGGYGGYGGGYSGYSPPAGLPSPPVPAPSPQQQMNGMSKKPPPQQMMMSDNRASNQPPQNMMGGLMGGQQHPSTQQPQQQQQQQQQQPPPQHLQQTQQSPQPNQNGSYMQQQQQQVGPQQPLSPGGGPQPPSAPGAGPSSQQAPGSMVCIRHGCSNPAITNPEWEDEYCSNECVVSHCRDVFTSWVTSNQPSASTFSTVK